MTQNALPRLRWIMIGLVFLATLINYLDRLTISVLAPVITKELHLTNLQFAWLGTWFLLAYTISQAVSGRLLDRVGTKVGFTLSVTIWSIAAMATAAARTLTSLSICRLVLGFGEAANWPGAAKVTAEWFPQRERAFAMAIFNSGAALGAVIGPPVIVFLQIHYGWQTTFLVTGSLGFLWLALWLLIYRAPESVMATQSASATPIAWRTLLTYREVWAIVLARVLCDPTWWLYITWLPKYLSDARGFTLTEIGLYAWVPYLAADAGSFVGGAASGFLISRGWDVHHARRAVVIASAVLMPAGALAVRVEDAMTGLLLMSVVLFAFQAWINNVQTIPSDLFPSHLVASVAGLGGFGAGLGSMIFTLITGWIIDRFSYTAVFTIAAILGPLATIVLFTIMNGRTIRRFSFASVSMLVFAASLASSRVADAQSLPTFETLLAHPVHLKPELDGVHPRVFITTSEIEQLRLRAKTTHRDLWQPVLAKLAAMQGPPPVAPGPQERRAQNNVAYAISEISFAYAIEQKPEYLAAARTWLLAAIDYEPWGYTFNKPNVDLAAGHLLYAIGWSYDLLYHDLTNVERRRIRTSLERHAGLVADYFSQSSLEKPGAKKKRFAFTQNHDFIPTAGLGIAALALMGESADAPKWAAIARAHQHRAATLLSPDGYYYEGMEYWIFSAPWLVHFLDAWEHTTGESLWEQGPYKNWKFYVAHTMLPDGQRVFDFGDVWEGPLTRSGKGEEYDRVYPGGAGKLQSNYNLLYRVATRLHDPETQAVASRLASFGHSNLEEYWSLIWYDPAMKPAPMSALPTWHQFEDSGVVFWRSGWDTAATAFAIKGGPPEGHRALTLLPTVPEWAPSNGHAHPDVASFIIFAHGHYLVGDTGYAGVPLTRQHNTIAIDLVGQGREGKTHEVWEGVDDARLAQIRITKAELTKSAATVVVDAAGAYDAGRGLTRFLRTFTFAAPGTFRVLDDIATDKPTTAQWYLHSDYPYTGSERAWRLVPDAKAAMEITINQPAGRTISQPTNLQAPGRPGSITEGHVDQRGYELLLESPTSRQHTFDVRLIVR